MTAWGGLSSPNGSSATMSRTASEIPKGATGELQRIGLAGILGPAGEAPAVSLYRQRRDEQHGSQRRAAALHALAEFDCNRGQRELLPHEVLRDFNPRRIRLADAAGRKGRAGGRRAAWTLASLVMALLLSHCFVASVAQREREPWLRLALRPCRLDSG